MGHPRACCSKWATHDAQNRRCPHGTNASRASRCAMRHTSHLSCDGSALTGNLVLFLVDSCIPARQWTDVCNTRCSILSRFSHFHVSHFPPLQHGAAFSCPAISCLAFSASPMIYQSLRIFIIHVHVHAFVFSVVQWYINIHVGCGKTLNRDDKRLSTSRPAVNSCRRTSAIDARNPRHTCILNL